jgi:hypothetical protein
LPGWAIPVDFFRKEHDMPQLRKGGKWVFGWCIVGSTGEIQIPPEAFSEYGFQPGESVIILRGSWRSGGFSIGRQEILAESAPLPRRSLGQGVISCERRIAVPPEINVQPGDCLLAVRGSRYAVLFISGGPICDEALLHPEIERFAIP